MDLQTAGNTSKMYVDIKFGWQKPFYIVAQKMHWLQQQ